MDSGRVSTVEMPECPQCDRQLLPSDFDGYPSEGAVCRYCTGEYL